MNKGAPCRCYPEGNDGDCPAHGCIAPTPPTTKEGPGFCTNEEAQSAILDALQEQSDFLKEALEQYAMIATPMGEIARTALAVYELPRDQQRRAMSKRSHELFLATLPQNDRSACKTFGGVSEE